MESDSVETDREREERELAEIALMFLPRIAAGIVREMEQYGVTAEELFRLQRRELSSRLPVFDRWHLTDSERDEAFIRARHEKEFMDLHHIRFLSILEDDYPELLREAEDAPVGLFMLGDPPLDGEEKFGMVGTRRPTPYGAEFCRKFVGEIAGYFPKAVVVSGLAYGIDAMSHTAALENGLPTIAVVAHGLEMIYPAANRDLARRIVRSGGAIVTEYPSGTQIHRSNFLRRNRIVAGMTPLTVVVESEVKGGAMSTANCAFSYNREVMALPGRITDPMSAGCNHLIRRQKATPVASAADVIELMGWRPFNAQLQGVQRKLFPEPEGDAGKVYGLMRGAGGDAVSVDLLVARSGMPASRVIAALTEMEFDGIVVKLPGARYSLC